MKIPLCSGNGLSKAIQSFSKDVAKLAIAVTSISMVGSASAATAEDVLDDMQDWLDNHPFYHAQLETETSSDEQIVNVFRTPDGTNFKIRMSVEGTEGQIYEYIVDGAQGRDMTAFFPSTNVTVRMATSDQLNNIITAVGGSEFKAAIQGISTDFDLVELTSGYTLTAELDVDELQQRGLIPQSVESMTVVYSVDADGKITQVVQNIDDLVINLSVTYVSFDQSTVAASASALPSPGSISENKTFEEAFEEAVSG